MEQDNIMKYYNSAELWDRPPLQNQLNIGDLVISKIPTDVKSILDVGSGNGVITNRLIDLFDRVCAVDISEEALKYVQAEKRIGSIDQLPFEDNEFDLILITDVLEHLPDPIFQQGIQELKRVAKKYVLIVTPFQEKLEFVQMKCKKCSCQFHVNLHIRSISKDTIESSFSNEFRIEELTLAGEEWPHFPEYASYFKSMFDYSNDWELAVCPQCGSRQDHEDRSENIKSTNPAFFDRIVDSIHLVMDDFRKQELMYNEALFLLSRDRYSEVKDSSFGMEIHTNCLIQSMKLQDHGKWNLDLANPFFERPHTVYFGYKPYVLLEDNLNLSPIVSKAGEPFRLVGPRINSTNHAIFILPKFTDEEFVLTVEYKDVSEEVLLLNVYDRVKSYIHLGQLDNKADGEWKSQAFIVPRGIKCPPEGFMFELTASEGLVDHHPIRYVSAHDVNKQEYDLRYRQEDEKVQIDLNPYLDNIMNGNCFIEIDLQEGIVNDPIIQQSFLMIDGMKVDINFADNQNRLVFELPSELICLFLNHSKEATPMIQQIHQIIKNEQIGDKQIDYQNTIAELQLLNEQYIGIYGKYEELLVNIQNLEAEIEQYKKVKLEYEYQLVANQNRIAELESINEQYVDMHRKYEVLLVDIQNMESQLKHYQDQNEAKDAQIAQSQQQINDLSDRLNELKHMNVLQFMMKRNK